MRKSINCSSIIQWIVIWSEMWWLVLSHTTTIVIAGIRTHMHIQVVHAHTYTRPTETYTRTSRSKITCFTWQIATQLKGFATQWENDSQYVYIVFLGSANHFLTWLAKSANHIFWIILHLAHTHTDNACVMQGCGQYANTTCPTSLPNPHIIQISRVT